MLWWLVIVMVDGESVKTVRSAPFTDLAACEAALKRQDVPKQGALACMTHDQYISVKEYHEERK